MSRHDVDDDVAEVDEHEFEPVCCERCGSTYCAGCGSCTWGCSDYDDDEYATACFNCGSFECAGYCNDYQTYNLRPEETGGQSFVDS